MHPWEAAEPLGVVASPSAPHAIAACIYLFNPPLQLLSWMQDGAALLCSSILRGYLDGYVLSNRRWALPWSKRGNRNIWEYSKSIKNFACPTGRPNQQKCWICWEMIKNWTFRIRGVFVLCLFWAWLAGGIGLFVPLPLLQITAIPVCSIQGTSNQVFSAWDQKILHFLQGLMWIHVAIWKYLHGLCWSTSLFIVLNSAMAVRCSVSPVPLSCV